MDTSALLGVFYFRQSDDLVPLCCQAQMENPLPPGASFSISRPAIQPVGSKTCTDMNQATHFKELAVDYM
ncbi:MAG TPA: hypothetical protein VK673_16075 [Chthoniobacterales bacterium]|nr:hypothetical protein [Chthoniobacterales bacterium]